MKTRRQRRFYLGFLLLLLIVMLSAATVLTKVVVFKRNQVATRAFEQSRRYISADLGVRSEVTLADLTNKPKLKVQQSVQRPIFMSTRRPYVPPPPLPKKVKVAPVKPEPTVDVPPTPPLNGVISGVIMDGSDRVVLMGTLRLREGMTYKGWRVVKIDAEKMELTDGKVTDTKYLRSFGAPKASQKPIIFE